MNFLINFHFLILKNFFSLKKFVITERYVKKSSIMSRPRNVTRIGLFLSQENDRMGKVINEACNDALPAESGSCPYNRPSLDYRRQFESTCCRNFEERSGLIRRSFHRARETNQVQRWSGAKLQMKTCAAYVESRRKWRTSFG